MDRKSIVDSVFKVADKGALLSLYTMHDWDAISRNIDRILTKATHLTLDGDFLEPENVDLVVILNSIVSLHRSRRV